MDELRWHEQVVVEFSDGERALMLFSEMCRKARVTVVSGKGVTVAYQTG